MNWKEQLENDGYTVINNVIDAKKCNYYINCIWDWLEGLGTNIKRTEPITWNNSNWPLNFKGIITYPSITHTNFAWEMRTEPKIKEIYKDIYGTNDLIVSFSRMNITKPFDNNSSKAKSRTKSLDPEYWFHVDQSYEQNFDCNQGFLNLENCSSKDSGLVVLKGSHKYHAQIFKMFEKEMNKTDEYYYELNKKVIAWLIEFKRCEIVHIAAPKGSFVLWNSRTFHCNSRPTKFSGSNKFRYVQYICMVPKLWISDEELKKKKEAFLQMKSTSPWPHEIYIFAERPSWAYNRNLSYFSVQNGFPILNENILKLVGFDEKLK